MVSRVLAAELTMIDTYGDIVRHIADRRKEIGLTSLDVDYLAGLPDGYMSKLECYPARHHRSLGIVSLPLVFPVIGLRLGLAKIDLPERVVDFMNPGQEARPAVLKGGAADDR